VAFSGNVAISSQISFSNGASLVCEVSYSRSLFFFEFNLLSVPMEAEARARKEKLQAMAALRKRKADSEGGSDLMEDAANKPLVRFRNYAPIDEDLRAHSQIATPADAGLTVEKEVKGIAKTVLDEAEQKQSEEVDLFNLVPKKPNWDLKRDVENSLARLERRTQIAIAELIRQRLQGEADKTEGLVDAMVVAAVPQIADGEDDDE
jgi:coiled-coil domain-containing protein 12